MEIGRRDSAFFQRSVVGRIIDLLLLSEGCGFLGFHKRCRVHSLGMDGRRIDNIKMRGEDILIDHDHDQLCFPWLAENKLLLAERIFLRISQKWARDFGEVPSNHAPPRIVDEMALSCLLLAVEWGNRFSEAASMQMELNAEFTSKEYFWWLDNLLWTLTLSSLTPNPSESIAIERLSTNLDHRDSSIRGFMMEMGWIVRRWLSRESVIPRLLKNVSDTLGHVDIALGLAYSFFDGEEDFEQAVQIYEPESIFFTDQFADRIGFYRDKGFERTQWSLLKLELRLRRIIEENILNVQINIK